MKKLTSFPLIMLSLTLIFLSGCKKETKGKTHMFISVSTVQKTKAKMLEKFGNKYQQRIEKGVSQTAAVWKRTDGSEKEFSDFCLNNFYVEEQLKTATARFMQNLESLYGNLHRISRDYTKAIQVDIGPVHPVDYYFANFDPFAHINEDFFLTKLAFIILLNYPQASIEEKNGEGLSWSREKWAQIRLAELFRNRIPASVNQKLTEAYVKADDYISNYNIYMHNVLDTNGTKLFPENLILISHWGLRDELKAQYANPDGFKRQKMIFSIMNKIITQEIPVEIINSNRFEWVVDNNRMLDRNTGNTVDFNPEPNTRYQNLLNVFHAEKMLDEYTPSTPNKIARRFAIDREMTEKEVENIFKQILTAPVLQNIAKIIEKRLGRDLQPFDIWYNGFKPKTDIDEHFLDRTVSSRYPDVQAFQQNLPTILRKLGFPQNKALFLANHIQVDPSRGAGHAMGAMMRSDKAHLRTRIPASGMKYKGFNIAIHELGHNVEQVFSLNEMDYYTLNGVPNTAFTEAFAFVFQSRDLSILGLEGNSQESEALKALNTLWATMEISGVALVDMYIWHWMYENPNASADELKKAVISIAENVWNEYFYPVFNIKNQPILAIYSHIIDAGMYTPDYPLGHIISFQIEQYLKNRSLASEMERMCKLGRLSPQVWMQKAVGNKVSPLPMIKAAEEALKIIK